MTKFLVTALPGIIKAIIAILGIYLAAWLSLRRFHSEKRWERKQKAYEEIIEALYDIVQYCEVEKEDYGGGTGYPEEKMKELGEKYTRAFWRIKKATDIGAFVVSPKAETILKELRNHRKLKWEENPPWDIYEQDYRWYRDALRKVVDVARRELKA
jgi:hypothetical protein